MTPEKPVPRPKQEKAEKGEKGWYASTFDSCGENKVPVRKPILR